MPSYLLPIIYTLKARAIVVPGCNLSTVYTIVNHYTLCPHCTLCPPCTLPDSDPLLQLWFLVLPSLMLYFWLKRLCFVLFCFAVLC